MPPSPQFALNFSGQDVLEQEKAAERLLEAASSNEHALRARLYATLAAARVFTAPDRANAAAAEAMRDAGEAGDEVSRAWALLAASLVDLSCEKTPDRLAMTREALSIAQATGESGFAQTAYFLYLGALAELGETAELDQALSPANPLFSSFPEFAEGRHVAWFRCLRATIDGHVDLAEQLAGHAHALAQESGDPDAQSAWMGQLAIIRWMQGRVVELEPAFLHARQAAPHEPVWAASLAWVWLRQGRRSAARALIASLPPVEDLPVDRNWLATLCLLAVVTAELRELDTAARLREALLRFEGRLVTIGLGITCWGTVSRPLALIAEAFGERQAAIAHYRNAIEMSARIGAHPWLAEAQSELAALLSQQPGDEEQREAADLASEAAATVRALRLHGIESVAGAVLSAITEPKRPRPASMPAPRPGAAVKPRITVLGDFEVRTADDTPARWQSRKARQLLKILIARRGMSIGRRNLMHMLWPEGSVQQVANRFSVAATTVRRAFDPTGALPRDTYLETQNGLVRLCVERLDIDVERFLTGAEAALASGASPDTKASQLLEALAMYTGETFTDEIEEPWAEELRREVHITFFAAAHTLAELSESLGDQLARVEAYRRILAMDEYDQRAHEGLIDALTRLRSHGQAAAARSVYTQRMAELELPVST